MGLNLIATRPTLDTFKLLDKSLSIESNALNPNLSYRMMTLRFSKMRSPTPTRALEGIMHQTAYCYWQVETLTCTRETQYGLVAAYQDSSISSNGS